MTIEPREENKLLINAPAVTTEEAMAAVAHHLLLAAAYFEATPDTDTELGAQRVIHHVMARVARDDHPGSMEMPASKAAKAWLKTIIQAYNDLG